MIITTTDNIGGKTITESLGLVTGSMVTSKNFVSDIGAGFKNLVGGELKGYTDLQDNARKTALKRLEEEAVKLGADAIVGLRLSSSSLMQGASEIVAYGTAVKLN